MVNTNTENALYELGISNLTQLICRTDPDFNPQAAAGIIATLAAIIYYTPASSSSTSNKTGDLTSEGVIVLSKCAIIYRLFWPHCW